MGVELESINRISDLNNGLFGPGSGVRSGKPLRILPLTETELSNRPAPGSAYVQSWIHSPTHLRKFVSLLTVTSHL